MADIGGSPQACDGDSGSPVFKKFGSIWKQIGIVAHGALGYTGFARYSNVRNWLAAPAFNDFQVGFRGFIFNRYTGRCITAGVGANSEANCKGNDQNFDYQSWRLAESGWTSDSFYVINGSTGKCLDLETTLNGARLVQRTCLPISELSTQRWRFMTTNQPQYRRLVNVFTNRCTEPANPQSPDSSALVSKPCGSSSPTWHYQAWMMTR